MFRFLNKCVMSRSAWLLLALSGILLECVALYFQHYMQLQPCILCIYQRVAISGVILAGLIGAIAPKIALLRISATALWIYSAIEGLRLAWKHTMLHLFPAPASPFSSCELFVNFPTWFPLNKWFPAIFEAYSDCPAWNWEFLGWSMPQWLVCVFAAYLLVAIFAAISQFFPHNHMRRIFSK